MQTYSDLRSLCLYRYGVLMVCVCVCVCRAKQLLERRIHNGREELTRMKDKMERKREAAKGRKRDLELQHAASIEEKRHLDDEAFKKNLEAQAVEQHVRLVLSPPSHSGLFRAADDIWPFSRSETCTHRSTPNWTRARRRSSGSRSRSVRSGPSRGQKVYVLTLTSLCAALYSIRLNKALDSINELNALDPEL